MGVSYGPKGAAVAKALGVGNISAPPFAKGTDTLTAASALGAIDEDFFKSSDFEIDCGGCTACCHGDDGPIILPGEYDTYECHKDDKGNMRLDQVDGHCVYLGDGGCSIHFDREFHHEEGSLEPDKPPKICRDFDCRSIIIKFNNRGLDHMVNSKQLPLDVVIQGRAQLKQFNAMIETRALTVGADLSSLLMAPAEEQPDAPDAA